MDVYGKAGVLVQFLAMKHGCGTRGAAPTSDAAGREGCRCPRIRPRHAMWFLVSFSRLAPMRLQLWPIRSESGQLGPYRPESAVSADSSRNSKKKKKRCKTHRLSQILNPTFNSLHTNTSNKFSTSLSLHHSSLTLSLLSVDVSACCETLSQC